MIEAFQKIAQAVAEWTGQTTNWSRWVGLLMIATILGVWARLCLTKAEWIDIGLTMALLMFAVFVLLARKAKS